jgi:hypothetical protein
MIPSQPVDGALYFLCLGKTLLLKFLKTLIFHVLTFCISRIMENTREKQGAEFASVVEKQGLFCRLSSGNQSMQSKSTRKKMRRMRMKKRRRGRRQEKISALTPP